MRRFLAAIAVAAGCLLTAGCGTVGRSISVTITSPVGTTTETVASACPPGGGFMGCASGASPKFTVTPPAKLSNVTAPAGGKFPDVSSYQGCDIDWSKVGAAGAAVKLGEGDDIVDPCAAHNIAGLRAAHKAVIVYWFVRPDSVTAEGAYIVAALKTDQLTISHVVIYTAPGTWPGGSSDGLDTWEAAYASVRPALPYVTRVLAWQFTEDGHVAGLGYGDVSVNYSLLALAPHVLVIDEEVPGIAGYAAPLAKYVLAHDPGPKTPSLPHSAAYYRTFPNLTFKLNRRRLNERGTVEAFDRKPTRVLQADLKLLAARIYHVAHIGPNGHRYRHVQWKFGRLHRLRLLKQRIREKL